MTRRASPAPLDIAFSVGAAATAALISGVVLAALSTPENFKTRLAAIERQTDRAQALLRSPRDRGTFGPDAVCTRPPDEQARVLSTLVSAEAMRAGLVVVGLDARPEPAPEVSERLTPVRLRFSVTGSYEAAVGLLSNLARERPQVFVDSLDMIPKVSNVTLSVSGRTFCGV